MRPENYALVFLVAGSFATLVGYGLLIAHRYVGAIERAAADQATKWRAKLNQRISEQDQRVAEQAHARRLAHERLRVDAEKAQAFALLAETEGRS